MGARILLDQRSSPFQSLCPAFSLALMGAERWIFSDAILPQRVIERLDSIVLFKK